MLQNFEGKQFAFRRSVDQDAVQRARHPVVVVGAGPVGLSLAIDLAQQGIGCVVLDDQLTLSSGSRAICFAKRTLEIFDRLQAGEAITSEGVGWHVGKVFFGGELLYEFDLASRGGEHRPAFINLQQYVVEGLLVERAEQLPELDLRFAHKVISISQQTDHASLQISTPEGSYEIDASYVVACDGARSTIRSALQLSTDGQVFKDRFLIADVRMRAEFPTERWFWFDPPFHRHQSALLHRQPGDLWRLDFQLGWQADPELEKQPERARARVAAMLGEGVEFDLVWVSVYTFSCHRLENFVHGRVIFAGDAAHGVSPFGARGANGGVQDADNLAWKLAATLRGEAGPCLLGSYHDERSYASDENILNSTRSTDFITPKSPVSRLFRDAALHLARDFLFARSFVNSGRLSAPAWLRASPLNTEDPAWIDGVPAGAPCIDAPIKAGGRNAWLLDRLGNRFVLMLFGGNAGFPTELDLLQWREALAHTRPPITLLLISPEPLTSSSDEMQLNAVHDCDGLIAARYGARPGAAVLVRPDQHVAARFISPDVQKVESALRRCLGHFNADASCLVH